MPGILTFFLPSIHGRPTGGNIFNGRLIDHMRERVRVHVRIHDGETFGALPDAADSRPHVGIIDSLLLHEVDDIRRWIQELPVDRLMLLAHYLHVVDPEHDMGTEAQQERDLLPLFDGVVATSQYVRQRLTGEGVAGEAICVLRPGVDERFRTTGAIESSTDASTILTVSSQLPVKGLTDGVEVVETLGPRSWRWQIVGEHQLNSAYAGRLRQRVANSPLGDRIELVGTVDPEEIIAWYDRADVFFLPSRFETCSMVTMEAMCRGVPVVAFNAGGLEELVNDGVTGYLAEPGGVHTAAGYIRALLEAPEHRRRMGQAARAASEQFPRWSDVANRFEHYLGAGG